MIKYFSDIAEQHGTSRNGNKSSVRALQVWQYLIGSAKCRKLVRYKELANLMGYSDCRPLRIILGHIMHYCIQNKLPSLTILVVNSEGTPGKGFTQVKRNKFDVEREKTFSCDWFSIYPPSPEELKKAWDVAHNAD